MGRDLGLDGVVDYFTLNSDEAGWLRNKTGATRLGFARSAQVLDLAGPVPPDASVVADIRAAYLGTARRAGRGFYTEPQEQFRDTLARSPFSQVTMASWDHRVVRSVEELVGLQFSNSYSTPVQLGRRRAAFERDLRQALLDHDRSGRYEETIRTEALIATRP
ncbi:hypothetical protein AB0O64_23605 [Streptomyces sp. NPDC088341]|uniref:hypothetical protein n=1 Tax=Streptomyces sp. NPDC088341 TaxID=3154870 RepID=UPI00343D2913